MDPLSLTFAARWLVSAPTTPLTFEDRHGQGRQHQDQAHLQRGHGLLLRDQEELAHDDREAEDEEVRPDREEARRIRRRQNQVAAPARITNPKGASRRPFHCVPSMNDSLEVEVLYPA